MTEIEETLEFEISKGKGPSENREAQDPREDSNPSSKEQNQDEDLGEKIKQLTKTNERLSVENQELRKESMFLNGALVSKSTLEIKDWLVADGRSARKVSDIRSDKNIIKELDDAVKLQTSAADLNHQTNHPEDMEVLELLSTADQSIRPSMGIQGISSPVQNYNREHILPGAGQVRDDVKKDVLEQDYLKQDDAKINAGAILNKRKRGPITKIVNKKSKD